MYCPINRVVLFAKWLNSLNFLTSILTPLTLVYTLIPTLSFKVSWLQITESDNNFYDSMYSAPSVYRPPFYRQPRLSPKFSSVPISPIKHTPLYCQTQLPPQVFRHKSHKTNLNSPVSTAHNYLLTAVYSSVIMECQNWSSDTIIDLIVEGRNR